MIYIQRDDYSSSLYKVEKLNGSYFGWNSCSPEGWYGSEFIIYPNEDVFIQAFLAPSILDRW